MMVGRDIDELRRQAGGAEAGERCSRSPACDQGAAARRQLRPAPRRDPRLRRPDGRRPHRGGAGARRRGPRWTAARSRVARPRGDDRPSRRRRPRLGIGYLSEDRKQYGLLLGRSVRDNVVLAVAAGVHQPLRLRRSDRAIGRPPRSTCAAADPHAVGRSARCRTCPAATSRRWSSPSGSIRDCDILIFDEPTRGIDVGAKDEIYALLERAGRRGQGDHHDLVRAARDPADVAPDRRDVRGPDHRRCSTARTRRRKRSCTTPRASAPRIGTVTDVTSTSATPWPAPGVRAQSRLAAAVARLRQPDR